MQVHVDFVDQHNTRGFFGGIVGKLRIELGSSEGDVSHHTDHIANTIAEQFDGQFTMFVVVGNEFFARERISDVFPAGWCQTGIYGSTHRLDVMIKFGRDVFPTRLIGIELSLERIGAPVAKPGY
ncbi:hypothetical protein D3C84_761240 [compost metagenome]